MIKSMTGFGRAEAQEEQHKFTVEIKSVNHRYLDFNIKMPKKLSFFDSAIRTLLKEYMLRGKVDIFISYEDFTQSHMILQYNQDVASQYMAYFKKMADTFGICNDITAADFWNRYSGKPVNSLLRHGRRKGRTSGLIFCRNLIRCLKKLEWWRSVHRRFSRSTGRNWKIR